MNRIAQELMTPNEAARWFCRSPSWLRRQRDLQRLTVLSGQPLYHVRICRAYVLGRLCGLDGEPLRRLQLGALASACGVAESVCAKWGRVVQPSAGGASPRASRRASARSTVLS
jgi:hypothetical protein